MSNKNDKIPEINSNYESVIILKNNESLRKNKLIVFPIPISITKSKYKDIKYLTRKEPSFNSFLFPNYSLNSTKNLSVSKEKSKSKSKSKSKDNRYSDITISDKFRKYKDDLEQIKIKINNIIETITENNRTLYELKNELKKMEMNKKILKTDLQNKISNMETLEENCKNVINEINNNDINNKFYLNAYENLCMELTLGDIKINNKETYIKRIFETFKKLNISSYQDKKFLELIAAVVSKAYLDFFICLNKKKKHNINSMIDNFFNIISSGIISYKNIYRLSQMITKFILSILFKIDILSENIGDTINYLKNKYEEQKNDLNQKIDEIKKLVMNLNKQKLNLELIEKNKKENLEFFSIKNSPYCEKTVSDKKKELALNNKISSIMRIYTEYNNKSKSFTLKKKTISKIYKNEKKNLNKFLTNNYKDLIDMQSQESGCHSNLSQSKLSTNGISIIFSPPENKSKNKFKSKINLNLNSKLNNLINISKNEEKSNDKMEKINKLKEYEYNIINKNNSSFNNKKCKDFDSFMKKHKYIIKLKNLTKVLKNGEDKSNLIISPKNKDFNISNKKSKQNNLSYAVSLKNLKFSKNKSKYSIISRKNIKYNNNIINKCPIESNSNKTIFSKIKKISNNKSLISSRERPNKIQISINYSEKNRISKTKNDFKKTDIIESFCFYKLIDKNTNLFNPLNIKLNLNKLGYNEGFISISSNQLYLILKPKNSLLMNSQKNLFNINYNNNPYYTFNLIEYKNNINNKFNNTNIIRLKKISKIYIDKMMQNIIKIRKIFLKYNNNNEMVPKKSIYINKILNEKEIANIKEMEQSEKIRAGLCNFFSFVIEFDNEKNMEIVLANFYQFISWVKYLEDVVRKNNFKYKYLVPNGNNSNLLKYKKNLSKIKSFKNRDSNGQRENLFVKRSFSESNNDKYNF